MNLSKYSLHTWFKCGSYYSTDMNHLHLLNSLFDRLGIPVKVKIGFVDSNKKTTFIQQGIIKVT